MGETTVVGSGDAMLFVDTVMQDDMLIPPFSLKITSYPTRDSRYHLMEDGKVGHRVGRGL